MKEATEEVKVKNKKQTEAHGAPGGFDLESLRLPQNYAGQLGVKKVSNTIPPRKPKRQEWVWVHPDPAYRMQAAILEDEENRETYLVLPGIVGELPGMVVPKELVVAITRQNVLLVWPLRLPGEDGRQDAWMQSALEAAALAQTSWIRIAANMSLGAYDIFRPDGELAEPEWPEISFDEIIRIAFRGRIIETTENPIVQRLRGKR